MEDYQHKFHDKTSKLLQSWEKSKLNFFNSYQGVRWTLRWESFQKICSVPEAVHRLRVELLHGEQSDQHVDGQICEVHGNRRRDSCKLKNTILVQR